MELDREFMSIGEVLSLLHPEFPDITISKIRFLESKGLLDPERTPSGYRKFYPHDIERLKVVLQMQKETFMPLRVIRDHLGGGDLADSETQVLMFEPEADASKSSQSQQLGDTEVEQPEPLIVGPEPPASITELSSAMRASLLRLHSTGGVPPKTRPAVEKMDPNQVESSGSANDSTQRMQFGDQSSPRPRKQRDANPSKRVRTEAGQAKDVEVPSKVRTDAVADAKQNTAQSGSEVSGLVPNQTHFSIEEITAETGAKLSEIAEMRDYGLIVGEELFGETVYSAEEMELVRIILRFRSFGIGARHLKLYKTSAERECGFLEQVVNPIFRKRNPVANEQARQTLTELRDLGASMRNYFLSRELNKFFDK